MFYKLRLVLAILTSAFDKLEINFSILKYNNKIKYNKILINLNIGHDPAYGNSTET